MGHLQAQNRHGRWSLILATGLIGPLFSGIQENLNRDPTPMRGNRKPNDPASTISQRLAETNITRHFVGTGTSPRIRLPRALKTGATAGSLP